MSDMGSAAIGGLNPSTQTSMDQWTKSKKTKHKDGEAENPQAVGASRVNMCTAACGGGTFCLSFLAGITMFVIAILACKGSISPEIAGGVMVGGSALILLNLAFITYNASKKVAELRGEQEFSLARDIPWKQVAGQIAILLPSIIGGALGIAGIASASTVGWIYMGQLIGAVTISCCAGIYSRMKIGEALELLPQKAGPMLANAPSMASILDEQDKNDLQSLSDISFTNRASMEVGAATLCRILKKALLKDQQFTDAIGHRAVEWLRKDETDLAAISATYLDFGHLEFKNAVDAFFAKHTDGPQAWFQKCISLVADRALWPSRVGPMLAGARSIQGALRAHQQTLAQLINNDDRDSSIRVQGEQVIFTALVASFGTDKAFTNQSAHLNSFRGMNDLLEVYGVDTYFRQAVDAFFARRTDGPKQWFDALKANYAAAHGHNTAASATASAASGSRRQRTDGFGRDKKDDQ